MSDILCIYYSRTGNTKKAMEEIAAALDAELAELRDNADRSGWRGWLRCGLDAMRKDTRPVAPLETFMIIPNERKSHGIVYVIIPVIVLVKKI